MRVGWWAAGWAAVRTGAGKAWAESTEETLAACRWHMADVVAPTARLGDMADWGSAVPRVVATAEGGQAAEVAPQVAARAGEARGGEVAVRGGEVGAR